MFTGIVEAIGCIAEVKPLEEQAVRIVVRAGALDLLDVRVGESIAVNGVCLTVTQVGEGTFIADVSAETLRCTTGLNRPGKVNLEKSMKLDSRLDGHMVSGHVDGVGQVLALQPSGGHTLLEIRVPRTLAKYIAYKGSVAINGVSLTVNHVKGDSFQVNLIPHTLAMTTLKELRQGDEANVEVDLLARYLERMVSFEL
jgi:riboflavin synthase